MGAVRAEGQNKSPDQPPGTWRRPLSNASGDVLSTHSTNSAPAGLEYERPAAAATPATRGAWLGLSPAAWGQIAVIAGLFALLFWPNLRRLWLKTNPINGTEWGDWSHSMLVPVIGLAYLWLRREELLSEPIRPLLVDRVDRSRIVGGLSTLLGGLALWWFFGLDAVANAVAAGPLGNLSPYVSSLGIGVAALGLLVLAFDWGIGTLAGGLALMAYGIWPGQNDYLKDMGMILALFGVVLTLTGWGVMRIAWFPIVYLVCAIPWPGLVYTKIAIPLQYLAAKVAVIVLNIAQVDAMVEGTRIVIEKSGGVTRVLNVAEACAGMRSLMTFITLAAAMAFLSISRPMWQKVVIVASAVPIAIFCNVMRVSGQGLLDVYVTEKASEGFAHQFAGMVMLIPAIFLLLGVGWVLDQIFISEPEEPGETATPAAFGQESAQGVKS